MRCSDDAEKPKNTPQVFPEFPIIKSARHCGKITIFLKSVRFMGTASGPAGCLCMFAVGKENKLIHLQTLQFILLQLVGGLEHFLFFHILKFS